ncbi:MAG: hypothetical protein LBD47_11150 [Treponema sp.]|jgi:hypothetical protein|nr:hypothetical protein [Treponema sp.]
MGGGRRNRRAGLLTHVTQGEKFATDGTDEHGQKSGIPIKKSVFFRIFREVVEVFPKLQFWENNLEIRSFARLKA